MDRMLNSKREKESIYEIYRACRLCGGGAGYKMPIIQNIVDLDEADVELKQKIRDCVQIEVHQDDKMPPLICELCVDKVNDFYEFLEMCRQTNKRTRLRLGLPPQSLPRGAPDAGDCILGLTEPVFVNEDSDGEPLSKHKKLNRTKVKKEPVVRIKVENLQDERLSRYKTKRPPTPPRVTRHSRSKDVDDVTLSLQDKPKPSKMAPKSILKKENNVKNDSSSNLSPRLKRSRDKEPVKLDTSTKKVKITIKPPPPPPSRPKLSPKVSPKSSPRLNPKTNPLRSTRSPPAVVPPKRPPSPPRETFSCTICGQQNKTSQARGNHMRSHTVSFTSVKLACNPCGEWFPTWDEAVSHQKSHRNKNIPYSCRRCQADFKRMVEFDEHLEKDECLPSTEVPDVKCEVCWHFFPTNNLLDQHKCLGEHCRPGGKCSKCHRTYTILKNLKKHETVCAAKKKGDFIINKELLSKVRPIQIRVARCDPLLSNVKQEHYDVSTVSADYGLDTNCHYPYIEGLKIKSEFPGMVDIQDEIKHEFCSEDYVHWDSEDSDNDEDISCNAILNPTTRKRTVESLAALTLKTIFSQRLLGKVPKKKRKLKAEKVFDSMLCDDDEHVDISGIIDNLGDDCEKIDDNSLNLSKYESNVSSDKASDSAVDGVNDNVKANDSVTVDVNESTNDGVNDSKVDNVKANDSVVDVNDSNSDVLNDSVCDSSSQLSNNSDAKADVVSSNDSSTLDLNKIVDNLPDTTNSIDAIKNNDNSMDLSSNNDQVISNKEFDENVLENDSQDSNSQSLLDIDFLKSNDSVFTNISGKNDLGNSDQSNDVNLTKNDNLTTDKETAESVSKNIDSYNIESKNLDLETNNANFSNDNLEFRINKNVQSNDSVYSNDSRYPNDSINRSILDEIDAQINDSNINNKIISDSDSNNDKIVLEDLLSKSTDSKIGLGSIEDYSFDS